MKKTTYEEAVKELDEIGDALEGGELSLDESLAEFARAVDLIKACTKTLEGAKKKMTVLVEGLNGETREQPFDPEEYRA